MIKLLYHLRMMIVLVFSKKGADEMSNSKDLQPVNLDVISIKPADNDGFFIINIKFDGSEKIYPYVRKVGRDTNGYNTVIISGCCITFTKSKLLNDYVINSVSRLYNVAGYKKTSTYGQTKARRRRRYKNNDIQLDDIQLEVEEEQTEQDERAEEQEEQVEEKKEQEEKEKQEENDSDEPKMPKKIRHEKYPLIKACLDANIPIYLAGPAGSGKNYTVEQIARENGWNFYYTNSVQQEYKLIGFIDAGGTYQETEFYKACTDNEECIFFLDEMDASIPEALVLINAAIANGYFEFPNGRVSLGDVHFVAAGNTVGSGADELYTGRMVLDQATLDRFVIIEFDYSRPIELKLTNGNEELVDFIRELRKKATSNGIRATFSYRCLIMVTKLEKTGISLKDILIISVLKGMDRDTINTLKVYGDNRYYKALEQLQAY